MYEIVVTLRTYIRFLFIFLMEIIVFYYRNHKSRIITICTSECEWQTKGIHEVKGLWCPGKKNSLHFIIVFKCTNRTEFIEVGKLYVYKRLIKIHINVIMIQLYRVCVCACKINSKVCLSLNSISILNAKIFIPLRQIC